MILEPVMDSEVLRSYGWDQAWHVTNNYYYYDQDPRIQWLLSEDPQQWIATASGWAFLNHELAVRFVLTWSDK